MSLTETLWAGFGLFFGAWGCYSYLKIRGLVITRKERDSK